MTDIHTDYATAAAPEYDPVFQDALVREIAQAIAKASLVTDAPIMAIRTAETIEALFICMIATGAMSPHFDTPSHLREFADNLAKRFRRSVAQCRAKPPDKMKNFWGVGYGPEDEQ
jgi:hypothetical protein